MGELEKKKIHPSPLIVGDVREEEQSCSQCRAQKEHPLAKGEQQGRSGMKAEPGDVGAKLDTS